MSADEHSGSVAGYRGKLQRSASQCFGLSRAEGAADDERRQLATVRSQRVVDDLQLVLVQSPRSTSAKNQHSLAF